LQPKTRAIEYEENEAKKPRRNKFEKINFEVGALMINPISTCEKTDKIFGSRGEAIIYYMWFEQGKTLFEQMQKTQPEDTKQEYLKKRLMLKNFL
jgi:hypothetical protein